MKIIALLLLGGLTTGIGLAADFSILPASRKAVAVPDTLVNPFAGPTNSNVLQEIDPAQVEPDGLADLRIFLNQNPVTAVSWTQAREGRSALLGSDVTLRVGDSISADYLAVGPAFVVSDIQMDRISFRAVGRGDTAYPFPINLRSELHSRMGDSKRGFETAKPKSPEKKPSEAAAKKTP